MFIRSKQNKGQNITEYVMMLAGVIAIITAMSLYFTRSGNARLKSAIDQAPFQMSSGSGPGTPSVDPAELFGKAKQYTPYYQVSESTHTVAEAGTEAGAYTEAGGASSLEGKTESTWGTETTGAYESDPGIE